jgi:hypothetical protein
MSVRYRIKCHFLQEVLSDPWDHLALIPAAAVHYHAWVCLFLGAGLLPFGLWDNLGKMKILEGWFRSQRITDFIYVTKCGQKS